MSGPLFLLGHSVKRARTLVLTTGVLLALFQVLLISVARSIQNSAGFKQLGELLPPFVRALMGPSFTHFMSFSAVMELKSVATVVRSAAPLGSLTAAPR